MMQDEQRNPLHLLRHELGPNEEVSCALDSRGPLYNMFG